MTEIDRAQLDRLLGLFANVSDDDGLRAIGEAVAAHVRNRLPADDPALRQWRSTMAPDRSAAPGLIRRMATRHGHRPTAVRFSSAGPAPRRPAAEQPGAAAPTAWDRIRERLLSASSLSEAQVRDVLGQDPRQPHLIRLTRKGGEVRLPSFQFQEDCAPVPLVLAINEVLRASRDPWGAADWWLGRNLWLGTAPAEVLGSVPDDELMAAALAVGEGD
ncbi:hypothetical protein [Streptomyces sp. NBC_01565]|uniref:hypothetical protein n=1 Tax=unclassified Streptomyces TaxID=2593676 RepID=UPI00224F04C4|nr:hypothetical protein [Streptomyces sp. NBC_01565]MCX4545524.1 hypothetical protein [Streptomyces sp. NBC_01565]